MTSSPAVPPHWIKPNHAADLPRCLLYLDTEAAQTKRARHEVQTWAMAAVRHDHSRADRPGQLRSEEATFDDPGELWEWIAKRCDQRVRMVLVAHNLAYDLRISRAFVELPARGWQLRDANLDGGRSWALWRNGRRSLTMIDSLSWIPKPLGHVGELVGIDKPPLPKSTDPHEAWEARCIADVAILREAFTRVLDWLADNDLGNFRLTGAAQSWGTWRHRFMTHRVLVHGDPEVRRVEREAAWTGRCEAWRHGELRSGPWHEWDYTTAYASIARECEVPVKLVGCTGPLDPAQRASKARRFALLQRVTVTTDVPLVPARGPHGVLWPVGTFETVLWDNEVALCALAGAHVTTHEAWWYVRKPALRAWAEWVLGELARPGNELDPVVRLVLKHWSRALIGRFAGKHVSWELAGHHPELGATMGRLVDADDETTRRYLHVGHDWYLASEEGDGPNSTPQVMSWIMAEARVRLWNAMTAAGLDHVVYVDTDSLIVDRQGHAALRAAGVPGLRVKRRFTDLTVLGPRQLVAGGKLRAAGIPRDARLDDDGRWRAETWSGLATDLRHGRPDRVTIAERAMRPTGTDNRRHHLEGGRTAPIEATWPSS